MCNFFKKKKLPLSESLLIIKKDVKKRQKRRSFLPPLTLEERELIQQIKGMTNSLNLNNVTRTKAYLDFYRAHPEVHWAFLGHMVSRNGGWNMTDLKGGQLSRLLSRKEAESYFSFLERGNWLIFQDAYPQFLLYEASKLYQRNLFYLLPHFHVSIFMESIWNDFWVRQDTYTLTVAQIINEQSYLEDRVITNSQYKKEVFDTLEFKLQDFFDLNHILFPFEDNGKIHLIGQTLHQFKSVRERILLGKRLYSILFRDEKRLKSVKKWAMTVQHSGSRKDYWPHIFNHVDEGLPGYLLKSRVKSCELTKGSPRIYSPRLEMAWKNRKHNPAEVGDWYKDWDVIYYLTHDHDKVDGEIKHEYCKTLEKFELAAIAKKRYRFWTKPSLIVTILFGALIGTYLDLYFVGKGYYSFPVRPFSDIFSIHVGFTLVGLPFILCVFLIISRKLKFVGKISAVLLLASIMTAGEKLSEGFGWFLHEPIWKHMYSLVGYTIYLSFMLFVYSF